MQIRRFPRPTPFPTVPEGNSLTTTLDESVMTEDGRFFAAVNAASNDVAALRLRMTGRAGRQGLLEEKTTGPKKAAALEKAKICLPQTVLLFIVR